MRIAVKLQDDEWARKRYGRVRRSGEGVVSTFVIVGKAE